MLNERNLNNPSKKKGVPMASAARKKTGRARPVDPVRIIDVETAKLTATEFCLFHYPTLYTAMAPSLSSDDNRSLWLVPIVLATPTRGVLGQVGELRIDARSGKVVASTGRSEVVARGEQLYREQSNASAAAISARK
jgi:hypothetical protein